jgi:hypothetical protein
MHQYAYVGKGETIHSSGQLEAHKQAVHDRSIKVGGKQRIETLDGYFIPLYICQGLPYMSIRPYTDTEWESLPHVILTADTDWNPSVLDHEQEDKEEQLNVMEDLPKLMPDLLFDEYRDYRNTHIITQVVMTDPIVERAVLTDPPSLFQLYSQEIKPRQVNFECCESKFEWPPLDIIQRIFEGLNPCVAEPNIWMNINGERCNNIAKIDALNHGEPPDLTNMPTVHPEKLVGRTFNNPHDKGKQEL